jgi:hypothetical protein
MAENDEKRVDLRGHRRGRYDRLKLNTGRPFSHLPKRPYPKGTPMFPHRDDVVAHLHRHAHEDGIELLLGTEVHRIDRRARGWRLHTSSGDIDARQVVVANGNEHTPCIPEFPGAEGSTIEMLHSSAYRNPSPYADKRVLVVGSGSSGMEIAHDLATGGAAKVWLAVRTPPNIMLRSLPGGLPGDLVSLPLYRAPVRIADAVGRAARAALPDAVSDLLEGCHTLAPGSCAPGRKRRPCGGNGLAHVLATALLKGSQQYLRIDRAPVIELARCRDRLPRDHHRVASPESCFGLVDGLIQFAVQTLHLVTAHRGVGNLGLSGRLHGWLWSASTSGAVR